MVIVGLSEYPYLLILINLCPGDWYNRPERINTRVDEENGKYVGIVKGRAHKVQTCSRSLCPFRSHFLVCSKNYSYFVGI